jgi:hypothetical protein
VTGAVRHWANWINGSTALGLAVARLGSAQISPGPNHLYLAQHCRLHLPGASAFTIGDVLITATTFEQLSATLPKVVDHEARHSTQYAVLGVAFWPTYLAGLVISWLRTGERGAGHPLERWAGLADGGYRVPSQSRRT